MGDRKDSPDPSLERTFRFYDLGFHGDHYILETVAALLPHSTHFIETGTGVGSTLSYVSTHFPHLQCLSCEPDRASFGEAVRRTSSAKNARVWNQTSEVFLPSISEIFDAPETSPFFWLDAHGYGYRFSLTFELEFILTRTRRGYVLVDDFKVPGRDCFRWHSGPDGEASLDQVKHILVTLADYRLYFPSYSIRTSLHHPLCGWMLLDFGHKDKHPYLRDSTSLQEYPHLWHE